MGGGGINVLILKAVREEGTTSITKLVGGEWLIDVQSKMEENVWKVTFFYSLWRDIVVIITDWIIE